MLELRHIHKYYNPGTVQEMCLFDDFNLTVEKGEFVSVVGSNGSGKTSMLNLICGNIDADRGQIFIDGKDITRQKEYKRLKNIGRVYQNPAMGTCPDMTIPGKSVPGRPQRHVFRTAERNKQKKRKRIQGAAFTAGTRAGR